MNLRVVLMEACIGIYINPRVVKRSSGRNWSKFQSGAFRVPNQR